MPLLRKIDWHKHQVSGGQWFLIIQKCMEVIDFGSDRCFGFLGVIFHGAVELKKNLRPLNHTVLTNEKNKYSSYHLSIQRQP
jgi:hypothetical protein